MKEVTARNVNRGLFITFEGGDGSGKTTQIGELRKLLEEMGYKVLLTREPGGTLISEKIRTLLLDPENTGMDPVTETMLYAAARAQLVSEVIRPALEDGTIVICDRFVDSSIAYQGYGRQLGDMVSEINAYGIGDCMPDLTIYLRLDPGDGNRRINGRRLDRIEMESMDFHQRVFYGYDQLRDSSEGRIVSLDAAGSIREIADQIKAKVLPLLEKRSGTGEEQV